MRALFDADILCYEYGNFKDGDSGKLMAWSLVRALVDARIQEILTAAGATSASYYLTDSKSNFRMDVATILPYKGKRPSEKPPHWANIRHHLVDNYDAEVCYGMEADDKCGIEQSINNDHWGVTRGKTYLPECATIIVSRDKDLDMIAGWHYSWKCGNQKERKYFVTEEEGIRSFYKQLLTGDKSVDNILGLFGVGKKSTLVSALDAMADEQDMFDHVFSKYEDRFGSYAFQFMLENAQLLWIGRDLFGESVAEEALCYMEMMSAKHDRKVDNEFS